jgi:hypothetical protein
MDIIAGMEGGMCGLLGVGIVRHIQGRVGFRIAGSIGVADTCWWKGTGDNSVES